MAATRQDLFSFLDRLGIETRTHEHQAVFTVAESLEIEKAMPGGHTKNLFLKDKKDRVFLVVALNDAEIDLKSLHKVIGVRPAELRQARAAGRAARRQARLGDAVLAHQRHAQRRVTVILDEPMMRHALLNYHPLENTATTAIRRDDLVRFIEATGHTPRILAVSAACEAAQTTATDQAAG